MDAPDARPIPSGTDLSSPAEQPPREGENSSTTGGEHAPRAASTGWIPIGAALLLTACSLVPLWSGRYFTGQNGPWTLLAVHMMHEIDNPDLNYSQYYEVHWHPIPYLAHTVPAYLLGFLMPIHTAQKVTVSLYAVTLPMSVFFLLWVVDRGKLSWGFLSFLIVLNWPLFRGYLNYAQGLPFFFTALGYWYWRRHELRGWRMPLMMLLVLLVFWSHPFLIAMLGLVMTFCYFHESRDLRGYVWSVIVPFVPAFAGGLAYLRLSLSSAQWLETAELEFLSPPRAIDYFVRKFFCLYTPWVGVLVAIAFLPLLLMLGRKVLGHFNTGPWPGLKALCADRFLLLWLGVTCVYFVVPYKLMGWHYVNMRVIPLVLVFAMLAAPPLPRRFRFGLGAAWCAVALIVYGVTARDVAYVNQRLDDYISGVAFVEPGKLYLPVSLDNPRIGELRPLTRAFEYYPLLAGGADGNSWAQFNTITPVWYKHYPYEETFPPLDPEDIEGSLPRIGEVYDYAIFLGRDEAVLSAFRAAGFEPLHEQGDLVLYENLRKKSQRKPIMP
jgi:hypothetical protein